MCGAQKNRSEGIRLKGQEGAQFFGEPGRGMGSLGRPRLKQSKASGGSGRA